MAVSNAAGPPAVADAARRRRLRRRSLRYRRAGAGTALNPVAVKATTGRRVDAGRCEEPSRRSRGGRRRRGRRAGRSRPTRVAERGEPPRSSATAVEPSAPSLATASAAAGAARIPTTPRRPKPPAEAGRQCSPRCCPASSTPSRGRCRKARDRPKRVLRAGARCAEAAQGAGAGRHGLAPRHGRADPRRPHIGQRRAGPHRPAHPFGDQVKVSGKPVQLQIAPPPPRVIAYHKPVGEIVTPRRSAGPSDGVPPAAAPAAGQVAVGRPARHQHRRPAAVHQLRRPGQPADASALRRRARVRGARARQR